MKPEDYLDAMLASDTNPAQIAEIGRMAKEDDEGFVLDDDPAPVNEKARQRVEKWLMNKVEAEVRERIKKRRSRRRIQ